MASILLTFVGQQDPFSNKHTSENHQEGSIVTLIRHLIEQKLEITRILLLHTETTLQHAIDTREWLLDLLPHIDGEGIIVLPVGQAFSKDPIDSLLAVKEARAALDKIGAYQTPQDTLEFNASSGTPAMKSAWNLLQAAGYAANSRVWQVRNPKEQVQNQQRVFCSDVTSLRQEFDLQIIKQQITDYNYSGALSTLRLTSLFSKTLEALLEYGHLRLCFDFDSSYSVINSNLKYLNNVNVADFNDIALLRQRDTKTLLKEVYYNSLIKLKNKKYTDFLIMLFGLQENIIRYLIQERLGLKISSVYSEAERSWQILKEEESGRLYMHLQNYRLPKGQRLRLDGSINRYIQIAILEYYSQFESILQSIKELNRYCDQRNESVHEFMGVSKIDDESQVMVNLRKIIKQTCGTLDINPFDRLNQQMFDVLSHALQ
jgi:hypothetical protein